MTDPTIPPGAARIHVHYPAAPGTICLRTDADWDADIEATSVSDDGRVHRFDLELDGPTLDYKPMLRDGDARWSCGPDRLATAGAPAPFDCFPYFEPSAGRLTERERVSSEEGAWHVRVSLPPGYDENTCHRYPTLFMNDGHNVFLPEESATGQDWDVQGMLARLDEMTSVEQVIVVGVYPADRARDYGSAGAAAYGRFLAGTLVPWIDERFRTLRAREHRAVLGSSLGGVSALRTLLDHPDSFAMAGCMSATFGYDDDLASRVLREPLSDVRIYLDSGWPRDNYKVTRDMRARLLHAGQREGVDLLYLAHPGAAHSESDWAERLHVPLQFFFAERPDARSRAAQALSSGA